MNTNVTFKSDLFKPFLPDESQVNPNCYGAELAYWLSQKLAEHGIVTSYPNCEDWGWFIEYLTQDEDEFWLCCGNMHNTENEWHIFLEAKGRGLFGRKKPEIIKAQRLLSTLEIVLTECDQIFEISWDIEG